MATTVGFNDSASLKAAAKATASSSKLHSSTKQQENKKEGSTTSCEREVARDLSDMRNEHLRPFLDNVQDRTKYFEIF